MIVICPICGVGSNLWPDYLSSKGTAVIQRMTYCGHRVDDKVLTEIKQALRGKEGVCNGSM